MSFVLRRSVLACLATLGAVCAPAADAQEVTVKVGTVRSISTVAILWAVEKGYFKEFGIKVVERDTSIPPPTRSRCWRRTSCSSSRAAFPPATSTRWKRTCRSPWCSTGCRARSGTTSCCGPISRARSRSLQAAQGQDHRHQRPGRGVDLRGRQDAGIRRADASTTSTSRCSRSRNTRSPSTTRRSTPRITIPPFTAQLLDGGHAVNFADPDDTGQAAPADHRGQHGQHRFRQGQPGADAELLRRLPARHPRLLPSLSRRRRSGRR